MPNTEQPFRLNWATFSTGDKRSNNNGSSDLSIFVGDLAADVTDALLHETFANKYPSVKAAKVVIDINTGRSKGYGFVRFGDDNERTQAMTEMNGTYCSTRPMRIGAATPRKSSTYQQGTMFGMHWTMTETDVNETKIQNFCSILKGARDVNALLIFIIEISPRKFVKSRYTGWDYTSFLGLFWMMETRRAFTSFA